jgi:hypothetical protein
MNMNMMNDRRLAEFRRLQIELVDVSALADANILMEKQLAVEHWVDDEISKDIAMERRVSRILSSAISSFVGVPSPELGEDGKRFVFFKKSDRLALRILTGNAFELVAVMDGPGWVQKQVEIENLIEKVMSECALKYGSRIILKKE